MKRSRFREEQIIAILREQEAGVATAEVCRKHATHERQFNRRHGCRELRRRLIDANRALKPVLPEPPWLREGEPEAAS